MPQSRQRTHNAPDAPMNHRERTCMVGRAWVITEDAAIDMLLVRWVG